MLRVLGLICLLATGFHLVGEVPAEALFRQSHPVFRVHAHRAPLPSNLVSGLALDKDGCLWAGTVAGVAKYDGRGWQTVPMPLPRWRVWVNNNALGVLEDGTVWVGTRTEGLFLHKDGLWTHVGPEQGLPPNGVNALLESRQRDRQGKRILYVGTYGGGLARLRDGTWDRLTTSLGLVSDHIHCLAEDGAGRLWVGTRAGLSILDGEVFRPFEGQAQLPDPDVRQLLWMSGTEAMWIGPLRGGICTWTGGRVVRHPVGQRGVSCLAPSHDGSVWVTFWGDGLARWDGRHWEQWTQQDGLPTAHLRCVQEVAEDGRSVLWIGSDGRGIFRTFHGGWRQFQPRWQGEVEIRAFSEGPDGAVWMGGRNFRLLKLDGRGAQRWELPVDPVSGDIRCLAWWRGRLYAGCDLELLQLGPMGLEAVGRGTLLDRKIVRCLAAGPDRLWVGASTGLFGWDGAKAVALALPPDRGGYSVRALAVEGDGLWIGTDGGLFRWDPARGIREIPGLPEGESVLSLVRRGPEVWVGTSSGRVLCLRGGQWHPLDAAGGEAGVQALLVNRAGTRLYAGSFRGVETWDLASGKSLGRATAEDGLPEDECLPGSLWEDAAGRIWVGTGGGAGVLDPETQLAVPSPKALRWAGIESASGPKAPEDRLPLGETWLSLQFALRAHHREEDTRYRTQLLPVESQPGDWGPDSHRRLQSLPRGRYVLQVWARDYQGQVAGPLRFPFRVAGRVWEHPAFLWALGLGLLATGGVLARSRMAARQRALVKAVHQATAALSARTEELEEVTRQQQEIMGIVAHDIRNPLGGISLMADLLEDETEDEERRKGLHRIKGAVEAVTRLLNQFLTLQSIEGGGVVLNQVDVDLPVLVRQVLDSFQPQAERKSQTLRLAPEAAGRAKADPGILQEVLSNLVSNALKYSPPGAEVTVALVTGASGRIRLAVSDQGPGLTDADKARLFQRFSKLSAKPTGGEHSVGLGLAICKRWVEAMGGVIGADSAPGQGATFWLELPVA